MHASALVGACHSSGEPFPCAPSVPPPPPREHRPGCAAEILIRSTAFTREGARHWCGASLSLLQDMCRQVPCALRGPPLPACVSPVWFPLRVRSRALAVALPDFGRGHGQPVRGMPARVGAVVRVAVVCKTGRSRPLWIVAVSQEAQPFRLGWACRANRVLRAHIMWGTRLLMERVFKIDIQRRWFRCGVRAPLQLLLQLRLSLPLLAFFSGQQTRVQAAIKHLLPAGPVGRSV